MLALSIRQPFAELILRGIKTVEYRSRATTIIGRRFWIYASRQKAVGSRQWAGKAWSDELVVPGTTAGGSAVPLWMIELARQVRMIPADVELPTGVIVGSAVIERVEEVASCQLPVASRGSPLIAHNSQLTTLFKWHLTDIERAKRLRKPTRQPQPVWFRAF